MDLVIVYIFLLPIFLYYISSKLVFHKAKNNLPPGNTGWPLIGETLELCIHGGKGIPERFFQNRMTKYSQQVFKTSILGEKTAVLCGVSGNKFLFSNENKLVSIFWPRTTRKILPHVETITNAAEETNKVKKILTDFLKPEFIQNCVGNIDAVARKHFDTKWGDINEVKALPLAKEYAFAVACKMYLSMDDPKSIEGIAKHFHVLAAGIYSIPVNLPGMAYNKGIKASNLIREKLFQIIRERKAHIMAGKSPWSHDILWSMIMVPDVEGRFLSELEIADNIIVFFLSSQCSTSTTITFLVKYLAEFHQVYQLVLKEQRSIISQDMKECDELNWKELQKMKYTWNVASEVMRLMPPVQGNFRVALNDITYNGFFIPKGWKLYWTPHTTHMNPDYFPEPEKFDPSRFEGTGPTPYSYVAFGGGSRICPGREFARIIILVFVHNLVKRFHWEKLMPNEKILIQPVPTPARGLPIRLHPHTYPCPDI